MECIYCGHKTKVTNSRPLKKDHQTWRRRECLSCHATVTSIEGLDLQGSLRAEKHNGSIEPFERDKLYISIYKAIDHLPNPAITASSLTATVLRHLLQVKPLDPVIPTKEIAKHTASVLRRYNAASSVRYLSFQTTMQLPNDVRRTLKR
jgi:transcriptional regulator NrdR family protein